MISRRVVLGGAVATGAALLGVYFFGGHEGQGDETFPPAKLPFALAQEEVLVAWLECLWPGTETMPNVEQLGIWSYIQHQLLRPDMAHLLLFFRKGAEQVERMSKSLFHKRFVTLAPKQRDEVVLALAKGDGATRGFNPNQFVTTSIGLIMEGAFADPVHGGNRNGLGWRAIAYTMHPPQATHGVCGQHGAAASAKE